MKPEEAIRTLNNFKLDTREPGYFKMIQALGIATTSIEKQVAKKPRYYIDNWGHNRPGCPGCPRSEILYAGQNYCSVCGTKIDWSEE